METLKKHLIIFGGILSNIILILLIVILVKILKSDISDNVQITLITVIGVLLTIISSIVVVFFTQKANLKEKKADAVRNIKLKYYHQFCEAYVNKYLYMGLNDCFEEVQANMNFIREVNRLPLYASQEIIELMEKIKDPEQARNVNFSDMYILIRKDLNDDEFKLFDESLKASLANANKVIVKNETGNEMIIDATNRTV